MRREGDDGTTMITRDVPDRLQGTGVLDDTVIGTAVRTVLLNNLVIKKRKAS